MLLVLNEVDRIIREGKAKPEGTINVITPETPYYTPPYVEKQFEENKQEIEEIERFSTELDTHGL